MSSGHGAAKLYIYPEKTSDGSYHMGVLRVETDGLVQRAIGFSTKYTYMGSCVRAMKNKQDQGGIHYDVPYEVVFNPKKHEELMVLILRMKCQ